MISSGQKYSVYFMKEKLSEVECSSIFIITFLRTDKRKWESHSHEISLASMKNLKSEFQSELQLIDLQSTVSV